MLARIAMGSETNPAEGPSSQCDSAGEVIDTRTLPFHAVVSPVLCSLESSLSWWKMTSQVVIMLIESKALFKDAVL